MENASKALIIAGAILISILLITLGVMIYRQASGIANSNAMDEVEISTFNSKYTQYEGDKVKGSTVNALLDAVVANNNAVYSSGEYNKLIKIVESLDDVDVRNVGSEVTKAYIDVFSNLVRKKAPAAEVYKVHITKYHPEGFVKYIEIIK